MSIQTQLLFLRDKRYFQRYAQFIKEFRLRMEAHQERINNGEPIEPSDYFVERFKLTDDYRRLLYLAPDLPEELLPINWLRSEATDLFEQYLELLTEQANQYFDSALEEY